MIVCKIEKQRIEYIARLKEERLRGKAIGQRVGEFNDLINQRIIDHLENPETNLFKYNQ